MPGGSSRVSAEAIARNREKSREYARLRRARLSEEEHTLNLKLRREYELDNREHINEIRRLRYGADVEKFIARPFIFWDGEGWTDRDSGLHHYMLFGCSMEPDSPIVGPSLGTRDCLDYLLEVERRFPDAFHVGFAFDYDVNMILGDLSSRALRHLAVYGMVHWCGYRIAYIPGKVFRVSYGNPRRGEERVSAAVFDMFGFFHSKYVTSLLRFGVTEASKLELIEKGKKDRPNFTFEDIEYVKKYWRDEISYGPPLADCIRDMCYDAGFYLTQWHGPGAIASYMIRKHGVNQWHSKEAPSEAHIASRYAYAGGRFQPWRCGIYLHPVYTADINSAYIYACSLLPRLDNGRWRRVHGNNIDRGSIAPFGLYHIRYNAGREAEKRNREMGAFGELHPLFHRDKHGNLYWPYATEGWYWSPEASTVASNPHAEFLEAWIFDDDGSRPFQWVLDEFDKRLVLQHANNPAEKTVKWGLAAVYGAMARTVGWDRVKKLPPHSHELMWAGFITSWCRAEMYKLARYSWAEGGLISIDTDGVTSTVPFRPEWLERGESESLGAWKLERFEGILYWQSGFYWLLDADGEWSTAKTRGIKRGSLEVQAALDALDAADYQARPVKAAVIEQTQTRFVGFKEALNRHNMKVWRKWVERSMKMSMGNSPTAYHAPQFCRKCRSPEADMMHVITHAPPRALESEPHKLPWLEELPELHDEQLIIRDDQEFDQL